MKTKGRNNKIIGREVTLTLGGVEIKGNLTKDLEMTNKEKYIPKVGEAFEWFNCTQEEWVKTNAVVLVTENEIAALDDDGMIELYSFSDKFRPIPTKADVEREQLISIIKSNRYMQARFMAPEIQNAGFTIPKKVKRSDLSDIITLYLPSGFGAGNNLTNDICNLLGDLVEDEA